MKKHVSFCLFIFVLYNCAGVFANWSVLEDDPRPREPEVCYQVFSQEEWNASNFTKEKDLQWFRDAKFGMFLHHGLSAYNEEDLSWGVCGTRKLPDTGNGPVLNEEWTKWPEKLKMPKFDAKKLVKYAKDAGMTYIIVIAKHHDGFHMWDTAYSDFKITNTPFGRDFLKEIVDECHRTGMKIGVYYSQRDWFHPDYCPVDRDKVVEPALHWKLKPGETSPLGKSHKKYIEYQFNVCRELCNKYGKLDVFWFDALWWGNMFTAEMWDSEKLTRMIRKLQPGIIINNRASIPGDFDTPEQRIGMFQKHRPWESCISLCRSWSYSNTPTKSREDIIRMFVNTLTGDGNLLLSWGAKWNGEFDSAQISRLKEVGDWVKKNSKAIYATRGGPWKTSRWGGSVYRGKKIYLHILELIQKGKIVLPGLKQKVLNAKIHGGVDLEFDQKGSELEILLPDKVVNDADTIIELTLDSPVIGIIKEKALESMFELPQYGNLVSQNAIIKEMSSAISWDHENSHERLFNGDLPTSKVGFCTEDEINPWVVIDLGKVFNVKGVMIKSRSGHILSRTNMNLSVSVDGEIWGHVWTSKNMDPMWDVLVTSYTSGAYIPGKKVRYIKIERKLTEPGRLKLNTVKVFGE